MKTRLAILILVIGLLLAIQVSPVDARSYYSERFDVQIDIQDNGSLIVTETVVFYFEGGPYTYAFRDLALRELDRVEILEASMDGQVLPQGDQAGQVEVHADNDPIEITWHFSPTSDTARTFTLKYLVEGNIRRVDGLDALSWRAIPEEHEYVIRSSTISIQYPPDLTPTGDPTLKGAQAQLEQNPGQIVFKTTNILKDRPLIVTVHFPQGALIDRTPAWQTRQIERSQQDRKSVV